jgi:endonuclease YncB( thermonuclease family)
LKQVIQLGKSAAVTMVGLLKGKEVTIVEAYKPANMDILLRRLCYVEVDGKDVGETLLSLGLAYRHEKFRHPRLERYRKVEVKPPGP